MNEITNNESFFNINKLKENMELAKFLSTSDLIPKEFRGKPANILIAFQMAHEVGLSPSKALTNVAVINGRPSVWGDVCLGLVYKSGLCDFVQENPIIDEKTGNIVGYTCTVQRKGEKPHTVSFDLNKARKANLLDKHIWKTQPERMLQMRARGFALRDKFSDVLNGMYIREEFDESPEIKNITPVERLIPNKIEIEANNDASQLSVSTEIIDDKTASIEITDHANSWEQSYDDAEKEAEIKFSERFIKYKNVVFAWFEDRGITEKQILDKFDKHSIDEFDEADITCLKEMGKMLVESKIPWEEIGK